MDEVISGAFVQELIGWTALPFKRDISIDNYLIAIHQLDIFFPSESLFGLCVSFFINCWTNNVYFCFILILSN